MNFTEQYNKIQDKIGTDFKAFRKTLSKFTMSGRNIDALMRDKVEDYVLVEELPLPITIGDRTIFVGNFTLENSNKFFEQWAHIIGLLQSKIMTMEFSEERRKDLLEKAGFHLLADGKWMTEFLLMDRWLGDQMCKIIGKTLLKQQAYYLNKQKVRQKIGWKNCSYWYFKKNVSRETLIQICWLIYFYNFDSVKKNAQLILEKMNMKSLSETYMYSWLGNLTGVTGKYLAAQAPSVEYAFRDSLNKPVPKNHRRSNLMNGGRISDSEEANEINRPQGEESPVREVPVHNPEQD